MILFFSGTGNSRYIAQRLAVQLDEKLLDMGERIRAGDTSPVQVNGRLVIVTPTYAWRIPRIVRDWLRRTTLVEAKRVWFVMSCGDEIGNADRYNRALCAHKGLLYGGTAQIVMPENYIAMFNAPDEKQARQIVLRAEPSIDVVAAHIAAGEMLPAQRVSVSDRLKSGPVNPTFYAFFVKDRAFVAGEACTGCGQCAHRCVMNNITLQNGRPVWGGDCTHCMACICYCPAEAIEYGGESKGKPRYHLEALHLSGEGE